MASPVEDYDRVIAPIEDRMIRCIWQIVRDEHDAEDALQDVLARIWRRRERVLKHANPTALVLRMCANSAYEILRQRLRHKSGQDGFRIGLRPREQCPPIQSILQQEQQTQVLAAIGTLPRKQAMAILLRLVEQMPYGDIAAALECTESTARVHVQRGREVLQQRLSRLGLASQR